MKFSIIVIIFMTIFIFSCKRIDNKIVTTNEYASLYKIEEFNGYKKIKIELNDKTTRTYILTEKDNIDDSLKKYTFVKLPIKKAVYLSTTQLGFVETLNKRETVKGVCSGYYIYDAKLQKAYNSGEIEEIGSYPNINTEKIIQINPDVVFAYDFDSKVMSTEDMLKKFNIPVVYVNEYLESHPLGRAEWIKFFGAFFQEDSLANYIFKEIEERYNSISKKQLKEKKGILLNIPFQGIWYLPGKDSYFVKMIKDAGGNYLWNNLQGVSSYPVTLEQIYAKKDSIDIWLNTGRAKTIKEIINTEPKVKLFYNNSIKIYNNTKRINHNGGNDFWESGVVRPDLILQDLNYIFEGDVQDDSLVYYFQIK